jgi:hypothetical protein
MAPRGFALLAINRLRREHQARCDWTRPRPNAAANSYDDRDRS